MEGDAKEREMEEGHAIERQRQRTGGKGWIRSKRRQGGGMHGGREVGGMERGSSVEGPQGRVGPKMDKLKKTDIEKWVRG